MKYQGLTKKIQLTILASGSEVNLALDVSNELKKYKINSKKLYLYHHKKFLINRVKITKRKY